MNSDTLIRQLAAADEYAPEHELPEMARTSTVALTEIRRRIDMDTKEVQPTKPPRERRALSGWLAAGTAFAAIVIAIAVVAVLAIGGTEPAEPASPTTVPSTTTTTVSSAIADATDVATQFVSARSTYDTDAALALVALDAQVDLGPAQDAAMLVDEMRWQEASGLVTTSEGCAADPSTSEAGTVVTCRVRVESPILDASGSDPTAFTYEFVVADGLITSATFLDLGTYSQDVWEPFHDWVLANRSDSYRSMFALQGTAVVLTDESIDLWRRYTNEYVSELTHDVAYSSARDFVVARSIGDLETATALLAPDALLDWGPATTGDTLEAGLAWEDALGIGFEPVRCVVLSPPGVTDAADSATVRCTVFVTSSISDALGDPGGAECVDLVVEAAVIRSATLGVGSRPECGGFSFASHVFLPFQEWLDAAHPELAFDGLVARQTEPGDIELWRQLTDEFVAATAGT
jgi:hypothetical protein